MTVFNHRFNPTVPREYDCLGYLGAALLPGGAVTSEGSPGRNNARVRLALFGLQSGPQAGKATAHNEQFALLILAQ